MTARDDYPFLAARARHAANGETAKALDEIDRLREMIERLMVDNDLMRRQTRRGHR